MICTEGRQLLRLLDNRVSEWTACRVGEWTAGRVSEWIAGRVRHKGAEQVG